MIDWEREREEGWVDGRWLGWAGDLGRWSGSMLEMWGGSRIIFAFGAAVELNEEGAKKSEEI